MFHHTLGFFKHHFGNLDVALRRFVKGGGDYFTSDGTAHFGYFFGAFVNQEDDEFDFRIVCGNGVGNVLQHHGFTDFGQGNQRAR